MAASSSATHTRCSPDLPVLFMSGYADRAFGPEGPTAGGGAFLQKPFTLDALLTKVRQLLT